MKRAAAPSSKFVKKQSLGSPSTRTDLYRHDFSEYNARIKVVDCTIRDGGLMNKWDFSDDFVRSVYLALVEAGVDYMEIGYFTSESYFKRSEVGPWRFCADADLRRVVGDKPALKLSAMADIGRIDESDIPPKSESLLTLIRVATYAHQMDEAIALAKLCMDKGYEVSINLMAVAKKSLREITACLDRVAKELPTLPFFYIADSFGSLYGDQVRHLVQTYLQRLPNCEIGYHGHNNQQLGFSNAVDAMMEGATMIDGSILGLGRGAGNTQTEHLLCFLHNPKYKSRPVFKVIETHFHELKKKVEWGFSMPYMISGVKNEHPKDAMAWEAAGKSKDGLGFYDKYENAAAPEVVPAGGDPDMLSENEAGQREIPNIDCDLYRREFNAKHSRKVQIVDNTIRDGGCMNGWHFSDECVADVYKACCDAGIDWMDIGYVSSGVDKEKYGAWRFCAEDDLRRVVPKKGQTKLMAMCDIGRIDPDDIPPAKESSIDMIRVACYVHQTDEAIAAANKIVDKGYESAILLMALSTVSVAGIEESMQKIGRQCKCGYVYIADSYGSLYAEQVQMLCKMASRILGEKMVVGYHGHNNLQLAFANAVQAIQCGAVMIDGSMLGLGRGAGNCPTEYLVCFLQYSLVHKDAKYKLRPCLEVVQKHIQALQEEEMWGPSSIYLISGTRNEHPRDAMAWAAMGKPLDSTGFYDFIKARSDSFIHAGRKDKAKPLPTQESPRCKA